MWIVRKYYEIKHYIARQRKIYKWKLFFAKRAISDHWKLKFGILAFVICSIITYFMFWTGKNPAFKLGDSETAKNLGSEVHGLIFDILLFGIILVIFEKIREKKDQVKRHIEELNDFRGWDSGEAYQRNHGILRRLINEGYYLIDMTDVFVKNQNITKPLNFELSQFLRTNLDNSSFYNTFMLSTSFLDTSFIRTRFDFCRFDKCSFSTPKFRDSIFWNCTFKDTAFHGIGIQDQIRPSVYFDHSTLTNCDFKFFNVYSITGFNNCVIQNCEAYEFQRTRLEWLGITNGITYIPNLANSNQREGTESGVLNLNPPH